MGRRGYSGEFRRRVLKHTYKSVAGAINFPGQLETTNELGVLQMPYVAEICDADPVSIESRLPRRIR